MKRVNNDKARHIGLRAVVAYPAVSIALVVTLALVLNPFGTSQVLALDTPPTPTETTASSATITDTPSPTATDTPSATTTMATTAPSPTTTDSAPIPTLSPNPTPIPSPALEAALAPDGVSVDHHVIARIEGPGLAAAYQPVDDLVLDASQFQTFRVRFQMRNAGSEPINVTPQLEYRPNGGVVGYAAVPEKPELGIPLHTAREWVPGPGGGTIQGPLHEGLAVAEFLTVGEVGDTTVVGHHSMTANPDLPITLPPASFTEQEFTVTLSVGANYLTGYDLRVTDGGTALTGTDVAMIRLGEEPGVRLSPGQRQGVAVENPSATGAGGVAYPLLTAPATVGLEAASATASASAPTAALYPLDSGSLSPAVVSSGSVSLAVVGTDIPIVESSNTHGQCAACHRGHSAKAPDLTKASQQSTLCFSCHDSAGGAVGTGAKDVKSPYTLQPLVNDPEKREYYSHDALSSTPSTTRPSACADCHNSHRAKATDSVQTADLAGVATGWSASGRLAGVSGVSVVNGAPGSAPTYTQLDGIIDPVTLEYQLCFKCHAGSENLLPPIAGKPSTDTLDKGVELNPANASFHPIEAPGKNSTDAMNASLAGTSPYKLWDFNSASTIRCLNCHATGTTPDTTASPLPKPGSALAPHTSSNRGILLKNYLDRELKPRVDSATVKADYSAGDFALCYVCHGEESFAPNGTSDATNFSFHSKHLTGLAGKGDGGTDIDKAGDGQGNATCAECHFRTHSTTNKVGEPGGSRLVKFAPNVTEYATGVTPSWTLGVNGGGSCTLTCHGEPHDGYAYSPPSPAIP